MKMQPKTKRFLKQLSRNFLGELIGTFVLVAVIVGGGSQAVLSSGKCGNGFSSCLSTGFGVMMAVRMSLSASGGHLNPCVTTTLAILGRIPWKKVPFYILAQFCGAFLASACCFFVYKGALVDYSGGTNYTTLETAAPYASFPQGFLPLGAGFLDAAFGSGMLILPIMALNDQRNFGVPKSVSPIFFGLLVTANCGAFGLNAGNPINPARDLGPRVFLAVAGWGSQVFTGPNYVWWWIPLVAAPIGGAVGGLLYFFLIEIHLPNEKILKDMEEEIKCDPDTQYTKPNVLSITDITTESRVIN